VLDDDKVVRDLPVPGTYRTLVYSNDRKSHRYLWPSQSRTSLLAWKLFGRRTDGFPEKLVRGAESDHSSHLARGGDPYSPFKGSIMPPPEAVEKGKVKPLTDEDRRTILRWIDLGCPIDLDFDARAPEKTGRGWMLDDQRPTLTLTHPRADGNETLSSVLVGMHDYGSGLDLASFRVTADFDLDGHKAGTDLAPLLKSKDQGTWELRLKKSITLLKKGTLTVSVKDHQGNTSRIERTFTVGKP
jgi:hypothetical protein